jgi:spermidine synthase
LLAPGGLLSFSAHASPYTLGPLEADYLACLARSARAAGSVSALPAWDVTFLVAGKGARPAAPAQMAARLTTLGLKTRFVTPYFLRYELSPLRIAYLEAALAESSALPNTDLSPRCFYFAAVLWSGQHAALLARLYTGLSGLPVPLFALLPLLGLAPLALGRRSRRPLPVLMALAAAGFATLAAQVALLILFQVAHGSLYLKLALLVAAFMAGLGGGACLGAARPPQAGLAPLLLLGLALLAATLAAGAKVMLAAPPWAFAIAAAASGFVAGLLFPALAAALGRERAPAAGLAYGAELAGSALGSVAASLILIPLAGIPATLWVAAAAGLAGALAVASRHGLARPR